MSDDTPTQPPTTAVATTTALVHPADPVSEVRTRLELARSRTRHALTDLRQELKSELKSKADWQVWYRSNPEVFLGVAFLVGFLYGNRRD